MQNLVKRLERKGWGKKEISQAVSIIESAKQSKSTAIKAFDKHIYFILLIVIIVANFAISVALVPLLVALSGTFLYLILVVIGIAFGLLFELVIRSIEHLEKKHHAILAFLIPLTALANVFVISKISNNLIDALDLANTHSSIIVSFVYAASFVLPYIAYKFVLKKEYYAKE